MSAVTMTDPTTAGGEAPVRDYLSYSAISTYQRCPLRYYFRYVLGLTEETVGAALVFGSAIHRAAEFHFRELLAGNPSPDLDTLLGEYQEAWREREGEGVRFGKGEDVDSLGELAQRVLTTFKDSDFAKPQGVILGIEEEFRGEVVPGCPELLARVDLVVDEGDALVVTDLKTARSRWSEEQVKESSTQLLLYHELVRPLADGKPVKLRFAVITKTKQPAVDVREVFVDSHQVDRTKQIVERVWRSIEAGHFYPAPSPMNCPSCPFREPCGKWKG